jgi:S1-C subfamily serine protease
MRCWETLLATIILGLTWGTAIAQSTLTADSVVSVGLLVIQPTHLPPSLERFEGQDVFLPIAFGTGFVVSETGYVVTALHVIKRARAILPSIQSSAKEMVVCLGVSPEALDCEEVMIAARDESNDLALLKIKKARLTEALRPVHLSAERPVRGTEIWAAGYSERTGGRLVVATGTFFQEDEPADPVESAAPASRMWLANLVVESGDSGSPVYLHDGSVIGVVVTRSDSHAVTGFVPAQHVIDLLVRNGVTMLLPGDSGLPFVPLFR